MKKIMPVLIAGLIALGWILPANAGQTATITVTFTPTGTLSISVSPTTWDNGNIAYGSSNSTSGGYFNITNDGTVSCKVQIKGSDTASFNLASSAGYNQFAMKASTDGGSTWTVTLDNTSYTDLISDIPPSGTNWATFDLQLIAPTSGSVQDVQQTVTVTLNAVSL